MPDIIQEEYVSYKKTSPRVYEQGWIYLKPGRKSFWALKIQPVGDLGVSVTAVRRQIREQRRDARGGERHEPELTHE
jgi:hypothetical protein